LILDACFGGEERNRTALNGFAGRCITSLLPRQRTCLHLLFYIIDSAFIDLKKAALPLFFAIQPELILLDLERKKSLELSTSTLARLRSTN
jgi:hypothetical protein